LRASTPLATAVVGITILSTMNLLLNTLYWSGILSKHSIAPKPVLIVARGACDSTHTLSLQSMALHNAKTAITGAPTLLDRCSTCFLVTHRPQVPSSIELQPGCQLIAISVANSQLI
jgi:hypothetical protein